MLASTTPAECIQERTASGSSFMLAVAPRGRLSWIPNISGARMLRASLLQLSRKNKEKKKKKKKSSRKNVIYRTERGF